MTCELSRGLRGLDECGSCGAFISAGLALYRVTRARLVRCRGCAERSGVPLPDLAIVAPRTAEAPAMDGFNAFKVRASLRKSIVDYRGKQAGDR